MGCIGMDVVKVGYIEKESDGRICGEVDGRWKESKDGIYSQRNV